MTPTATIEEEHFPAHVSPVAHPVKSPWPKHPGKDISQLSNALQESLKLDESQARSPSHSPPSHSPPRQNSHSHVDHINRHLPANVPVAAATGGEPPPPSLLSPAFTPPSTPGGASSPSTRIANSIPVDSSASSAPGLKLLDVLPEVECVVRARIPTTTGQEMFLHLYTNNIDSKEHLAIVFGPHIRSRSLDKERPGETEMDRMIRGAYTGRLYPGRTSSKVGEDAEAVAGRSRKGSLAQASPLEKSLHRSRLSSTSLSNAIDTQHKYPPLSDGYVASLSSTSSNGDDEEVDDDLSFPLPASEVPLVRIHSECYTGETVWSARCDCGEQLDEAARLMSLRPFQANAPSDSSTGADSDPGGVIIYLRQEGRGIGLGEKLKAYNLQDLGSDTVEANILLRHPADARSYGLATAMLIDLGLDGERGIRLLTNNPDKIRAVEGPGREVRVRERVAMVPLAWKTGGKKGVRSTEVESYLRTKIEQFGHMLTNPQ